LNTCPKNLQKLFNGRSNILCGTKTLRKLGAGLQGIKIQRKWGIELITAKSHGSNILEMQRMILMLRTNWLQLFVVHEMTMMVWCLGMRKMMRMQMIFRRMRFDIGVKWNHLFIILVINLAFNIKVLVIFNITCNWHQ